MPRKLIVLTPVRNEAWILAAFITACERFADEILIADQGSIDDSRRIAERSPKVHLLHNESNDFNENERVQLLISTARRRHGTDAVLVALDADEIPVNTPEALDEWRHIRELAPGTGIRFAKPDLIKPDRMIDTGSDWQLGYVDDGAPHTASAIHAQRVPAPAGIPIYSAEQIRFLHINVVRHATLRAKRRMYCALENINGSKSLPRRLIAYDRRINFAETGAPQPMPEAWRTILRGEGLDLADLREERPFWQDCEVVRLFHRHGERRFFWDDIWDTDWNEVARQGQEKGWLPPTAPRSIQPPSPATTLARECLQWSARFAFRLKTRLTRR
ncbi:MAG: glycosyltransferase family 2 protein, partial [Opitutales bacterium]